MEGALARLQPRWCAWGVDARESARNCRRLLGRVHGTGVAPLSDVRSRVIGAAIALAAGATPAAADLGPRLTESRAERARVWRADGGWIASLPQRGEGTRVAAFLEAAGPAPVGLEARGVDEASGRRGRWLPMEETFREGSTRVAVVDLARSWPAAEIRLARRDESRVADLGWEL